MRSIHCCCLATCVGWHLLMQPRAQGTFTTLCLLIPHAHTCLAQAISRTARCPTPGRTRCCSDRWRCSSPASCRASCRPCGSSLRVRVCNIQPDLCPHRLSLSPILSMKLNAAQITIISRSLYAYPCSSIPTPLHYTFTTGLKTLIEALAAPQARCCSWAMWPPTCRT